MGCGVSAASVRHEQSDWRGKLDHVPEVYKKKGCRIKDTAERGISLQQLCDFGSFIKSVLDTRDVDIKDRDGVMQTWNIVNVYVINDDFVKPLTSKEHISFVELVAEGAQVPVWFISHWWGTPFCQSLRMLRLHHETRKLEESSYYWMCTFANNQHELDKELSAELSKTPFLRVLNSDACRGTVALMDRKATPFSRIWCVLEAFEAMTLGLPYDMAAWLEEGDVRRRGIACAAQASLMLDDEAGTMACEEQEIMSWPFPFVVAKAAANTKVKKAESSRLADRQLILDYILGREQELDAMIHEKMSSRAIYGFIKDGDLLMIRKLLDKFPSLLNEALDGFGATPTFVAAEFGQRKALEMLLESQADINKGLKTGITPTFIASQEGQSECLKLLLSCRADMDRARTDDGVTPTFIATEMGQVECLELLISSRADMDKGRSDDGETPTYIAAGKSHLECLKLLVSSRADVDKGRSDSGSTPTFIASQEGQLECLKLLIAFRADVDRGRSDTGVTPTFVTSQEGHIECLKLLISSQADINKGRSDMGVTPTFVASQEGQLACLKLLLSSRADMNKGRSDIGITPTFIASHEGHLECLKLLISSQADINKGTSDDGCTPLAIARSNGHDDVVQELLHAGATE